MIDIDFFVHNYISLINESKMLNKNATCSSIVTTYVDVLNIALKTVVHTFCRRHKIMLSRALQPSGDSNAILILLIVKIYTAAKKKYSNESFTL